PGLDDGYRSVPVRSRALPDLRGARRRVPAAGGRMISLHTYLIYFSLYAIAVAIPGPGILAIVARALGNTLGDLILMSLSAFGLAVVAREMGSLFLIVKLAGAAYLVWLGYRYWTAPVADLQVVPSRAHQGFV